MLRISTLPYSRGLIDIPRRLKIAMAMWREPFKLSIVLIYPKLPTLLPPVMLKLKPGRTYSCS
jgi:hypothetical protein